MDLNDASKGGPVGMGKVEAANSAGSTMGSYAGFPGHFASLIAVERDLAARPFPKLMLNDALEVTTQYAGKKRIEPCLKLELIKAFRAVVSNG